MTAVNSAVRNGGQILIEQLRIHGTKRVFLVPGESYLPCIDALYDHQDEIEAIVCRQESGAAYMAEAYGKLVGEPGICFVTRGPGATNASIGVHTAFQDSTPMILFIGQVGNDFRDREAFQEVDYRQMFGDMAKWVAQIDRTDRIPEYLSRAFAVATSGRPGPVVLALPEDTLWGTSAVADAPRYLRVNTAPGVADLQRLRELLETAKNPVAILGGSGWTEAAAANWRAFAERFDLPVAVAWRRLECFDQRHPNFIGHVGWGMTAELRQRMAEADVVLAVGTRLGEATSEGYSWISSPTPKQELIHVYPDASELGRVYHPTLAIVAAPSSFANSLDGLEPQQKPTWSAATRDAHGEYRESLQPLACPGPLSLDEIAAAFDKAVPAEACVTAGAGNYALYPHRHRRFGGLGSHLSPTVGSMGYGLPAAISAKLENPEKEVFCYAGDGCFQMSLQELGVAMQYRVGIVVLVFNNGMWGTIRAHQENEFPGRTVALTFENPDFVQLIRAYGGYGEVVDKTGDFTAALNRARRFAAEQKLPALLEIRYDPDASSPGTQLSTIRQRALASRAAQAAATTKENV